MVLIMSKMLNYLKILKYFRLNNIRLLNDKIDTSKLLLPNSKIRNIGISAHIDSGKTTLTERILFYTRRIEEIHEVKSGATMDFMQLERERGITIQSAATYTKWNDHNINLIDTPGHIDFTIEVERALHVLDGAILVLCAVGGVQTQTYTVLRQINRYNVPFIAFINKLDRIYAEPFQAFEDMNKKLNVNAGLVQLPIGIKSEFNGIIDLIRNQAVYFEGIQGLDVTIKDIPTEYLPQVNDYRKALIENLSNIDTEIGEMYISDIHPSEKDIDNAIRRMVISRKFVPVHLGSALKNKGVQLLLDNVIRYLPDPSEIKNYAIRASDKEKVPLCPERSKESPPVALAFKLESGTYGQLTYIRMYQGQICKNDTLLNARTGKTIRVPKLVLVHARESKETQVLSAGDIGAFYGLECNSGDTFIDPKSELISMESMYVPEPVVSLSVESNSSNDMIKLAKAFSKFQKEDPTFRVHSDPETREVIMSGMGELHLDIYVQRLNLEFGIKVNTGKPKVSYRETLREIERFDYLHKRQSGGRGQYAQIIGRVEPLPPKLYDYLEFVDETRGTAIPKNFVVSIEKGFYEACERGYLSGHRVSGIKFVIETGGTHLVDSSDYAFRLATISAMKQIFSRNTGYIIEPIMNVEVVLPSEYNSAISKVILDRKGRIKDYDQNFDILIIKAEVPLSDMFGFTGSLRQTTQGKGEYSMEFSHYAEVPIDQQQKLMSIFNSNINAKNKK